MLYRALCVWLVAQAAAAMIMRNNALLSKMVSNFQSGTGTGTGTGGGGGGGGGGKDRPQPRVSKVVNVMQDVLCRNFPNIPCSLIRRDAALQSLIERSVQQIKNKEASLDAQTSSPAAVNSEDLSSFLMVSNTGLFRQKKKKEKKSKKPPKVKNVWSHKRQTEAKSQYGRKKVQKFYPHKKKDNAYYDDIKSMSVEVTEASKKRRYSFKREPAEGAPVWQIDYVKGESGFDVFGARGGGGGGERGDALRTKLIKQGPNMLGDGAGAGGRPAVMHPDVYIKKNIINRRNSGREMRMD